MRKFISLLLLMGAFGYGLAQPLAIDTAWFRHVPSAHHLTYWFDNNSASAQELSLSQTSLQMDVSFLPLGVHTIHCYAVDSAGVVYPTTSAMFFYPSTIGTDSTAAQQVVYWFDQDFDNRHVSSLHSSPQLIDVSALAMGVHTLHSYVVGTDNTVYPTSSAMFFCPPTIGTDSTAAQQVVYWFDQDFDNRHVSSLHSGPQLIDVSALAMGVHTLHSYVVGIDNTVYPTSSAMFFCPPTIGTDSTAAQQVVYWFDQDFDNRHVSSLHAGPQLIDVSALAMGVHTLHSYVVGIDNTVYPTSSAMFFCPPTIGTDSTVAQQVVYWFDQDFDGRHFASLQSGPQLLDVSDLDIGVHTIHSYVVGADNKAYPTTSVMFFRLPYIDSDSAEAQEVVYWFDQDYANRHIAPLQAGTQMLEVSALSVGVHTLHSYVVGTDNTVYPTSSAMFFRPPAIGADSTAAQEVVYWFDQDYAGRQRTTLLSMSQTLDVSNLSTGVHTLHCYVMGVDGVSYPTTSSMFFRPPGAGSESVDGITQYYYWFNNDITNATRVHVNPVTNPLQWYGLIPIESIPFRSTYFHFEIDTAQQPHAYAKNTFHTLFMDDMGKFVMGDVAPFVDYHVSQPVVSDTILSNTSETFPKVTNNNIKWFRLTAQTGDSLAFKCNLPCTLQLFDPTGEEVYRASGDNSIHFDGTHAWHDGTYYLAVHDATYNGVGEMTVWYQNFDRIAILGWDVRNVGNVGYSGITICGNGFDELESIKLVNVDHDTIHSHTLVSERTRVMSFFEFESVDTGEYSGIFYFNDSVVYITNMVHVEFFDSIDLESTMQHQIVSTDSIVTFRIRIHNNGNITAFGVPIYLYLDNFSNTEITKVTITTTRSTSFQNWEPKPTGLPPFLNPASGTIGDLSSNEINEINEEVNRLYGDKPYFVPASTNNQDGRQSPMSTQFEVGSIPPNGDVECDVEIRGKFNASGKGASVHATVPYSIPALNRNPHSGGSQSNFWCCHHDKIECVMDIGGLALDFIPGLQPWGVMLGTLSTGSSLVSLAVCDNSDISDVLQAGASVVGTATDWAGYVNSVIENGPNIDWGKWAKDLGDACGTNWFKAAKYGVGLGGDILGCVTAFTQKKPDCDPNHPDNHLEDSYTRYIPVDPNDIAGYRAESGSHHVRKNISTLSYEIHFENDSLLASSSAHTVIVRDTLDADKFDLSTFKATSVNVGGDDLSMDNIQSGIRTLDLRPRIPALAQIQIQYDSMAGVATWTLNSLDPITLEPITDQDGGILPINNTNGSGMGFVSYQIDLSNNLVDGDSIHNKAYISFDNQAPIATPVWTNVIDTVSPTSDIVYGDLVADSITLSFQGNDNRSGVWRYELYGRQDSLSTWNVVADDIENNVYSMSVDSLLTDFYVVAIDSAGNRENKTPQVEYNTSRGVVGPSVTTYQIQFVNFDNMMLCSYRLPMGATPAYLGSTPSHNADAHYSYRFRGWTPAIAPVAGNAVYHAVYDSIPNSYRICFFDYDSTLLQSDSLPYGAMPAYYSSIPSRPEVDSFVYAFVGWTPELMPVSGNADYRPVFDSMLYYQLPRYLVTFRNWNDSVLQSDSVTFGTMPHYWGMEPTREGNAYCDYRFRGWTPRLAPVTDSVVYTAEFDTMVHTYPVTFVNFNGTVLQQDTLPYGSVPVYRGSIPARRTTIQYTYTFVGWSPNIDTVRGAAVYTAVFDSVFSCISQYHYDNISTCDSVIWRGNVYATSGTYSERVEGVAYGCDSVYVLNLTIKNKSYVTDEQIACDFYTWHGTTYTASTNTPTHTGQNVEGCDSVVTLHLTINHSNTGTDVQTACDSYTWQGTTYTASTNTPTFAEQNADGCDSVVTLHLTINHSNTGTDVQTACDSYTWHGTTYTASTNTPTFTEQNVEGCDSVVTLHLTINHSNTGTDVQTACDTYTWHGTTYTASTNTPTFTEQNVEGCDSVVTLHLTINHSNTGTDVQTACDSYTWHGTTYTASTNTPTFTEQNADGCDSVVTLHLTINHSNTGTDVQTACDSYTWHGTTYTASTNTPTFTEQNVEGCDSVVTLHLTINHSTSIVFDLADCDSVTWSDWTFYASTDTTIVLTNSVGCDSLNMLHLIVNYTVQTTIVDSAQGSYDWNGQTYTESGEYVFTSQTEAGCDSIVTLILTITQTEGILLDGFEQMNLYPNPTTGKIVIDGMKVVRVEVYDLEGRLVDTFMNTNSFDISQLSSGTYLVRITMPQGETIRRVIKH